MFRHIESIWTQYVGRNQLLPVQGYWAGSPFCHETLGRKESRYLTPQRVINALRSAGLDPAVAAQIPIVRIMAGELAAGRLTLPVFIQNVQKLAILHPKLRLQEVARSQIIDVKILPPAEDDDGT